MNDINLAFNGFKGNAAKKSLLLKRILTSVVNKVESDIKLITSTPKYKGSRMEISFSKYYDDSLKFEPNLHITMDYDSGYISHNHESNSDSSSEMLPETIAGNTNSKPIYLSEDALLEKPEVSVKSGSVKRSNLSIEIEKEDYEETRNLFNSPDTVLSSSIISQETNYSGFENDSDSDISIEIPKAKQIIVEMTINNTSLDLSKSLNVSDNCNIDCDVSVDSNSDFKIGAENPQDSVKEFEYETETVEDNSTCHTKHIANSIKFNNDSENAILQNLHLYENNRESNSFSALSNITNVCNTISKENENKKLTLIFSKCSKENTYSVKRKYRSITPDKNLTPEKLSMILEKVLTPKNKTLKEHDIAGCKIEIEEAPKHDPVIESSILGSLTVEETGTVKEEEPESKFTIKSQEDEKDIDNTSKQNVDHRINLLSATPEKTYQNYIDPNISPDLFVEEEPVKSEFPVQDYIAEERFIIKKDHKLLKRVQNSLKGVLPPFSVTVLYLSVDEMLNRLESNKEYFWNNSCSVKTNVNEESVGKLNVSDESNLSDEYKSLLINGPLKDFTNKDWPKELEGRFHGLHHNRSKISEELEELCAKYGQRYVGAETQSTCTVFETNITSPMKRKQVKPRWAVKSPGRRLSHLARRRITFSSANLQAGGSSVAGSRARQILVDARKLDLLRRRSPRKSPRKTPRKSPRFKTHTPSSSAKKKLAMRFRELTGEIEKTGTSSINSVLSSKRALFLSPDRNKNTSLFMPSTSGTSTFNNNLKNPNTKRALFKSPIKGSPVKRSPFKRSPFKSLGLGMEKKRKRSESDDIHPSKLSRSMSADVRPTESELDKSKFMRTASDMSLSLNRTVIGHSGELSATHKKKLQWAVYEALRSQNITPSHTQFKLFASILARVTRRFLPNLTSGVHRLEGSTTERMLRIARHHVYAVVKGKSVDEIINEYLKSRPRNVKPQGYIGLEEFANEKRKETVNDKENVVQGRINTIESLEKKKLEQLGMPKCGSENKIERIRKAINFGDDNR